MILNSTFSTFQDYLVGDHKVKTVSSQTAYGFSTGQAKYSRVRCRWYLGSRQEGEAQNHGKAFDDRCQSSINTQQESNAYQNIVKIHATLSLTFGWCTCLNAVRIALAAELRMMSPAGETLVFAEYEAIVQ